MIHDNWNGIILFCNMGGGSSPGLVQMAKTKTRKLTIPTTLYTCCSDPECKSYQNTINFLKTWGFNHKPQQDGKRLFFNIEVPDHWGKVRRARFVQAVAKHPTGH